MLSARLLGFVWLLLLHCALFQATAVEGQSVAYHCVGQHGARLRVARAQPWLHQLLYQPPISGNFPTAALPVNFFGASGMASKGSGWDPAAPVAPPLGSRYAILQKIIQSNQTSTIQCLVDAAALGNDPALSIAVFAVSYFYSVRAETGTATNDTLSVTVRVARHRLQPADCGCWSGSRLRDRQGRLVAMEPQSSRAATGRLVESSRPVERLVRPLVRRDRAECLAAEPRATAVSRAETRHCLRYQNFHSSPSLCALRRKSDNRI